MIPALLTGILAAWQGWAGANGMFRADGADPGPWPGAATADAARFETLTPARFPGLKRIVNGHWVTVDDPLAGARQLVEVRLNRISYDYIRAQGLYTVAGQRRAVAAGPVQFPIGAVQVKAAWRPIGRADRGRYRTLRLRVAGRTRLFGLAALNVAAKTGQGWLWASFEHSDDTGADADRGPPGTVWNHYRLRGIQTAYLDASGRPVRLGNAVLEPDLGDSASCMTCHARATLGVAPTDGRLPVFAPAPAGVLRGYVGTPDPAWFGQADAQGHWHRSYATLDFVWSLSQAAARGPASTPAPPQEDPHDHP